MYIHIANGTGSTPCRRARALETVGATGSETMEIAAVGPKMGRYPEEMICLSAGLDWKRGSPILPRTMDGISNSSWES